MNINTVRIVLIHAFVGWICCAAVMSIGMLVTTIDNALYIHAALAPVIFVAVSLNIFKRYNLLSPIKIAFVFVTFIIVIDFFVVALLINRSLEMFSSILGTWIPFALIFISTYTTGTVVTRKGKASSKQIV